MDSKFLYAGLAVLVSAAIGITKYNDPGKPAGPAEDDQPGLVRAVLLFFYACFLKPHAAAAAADDDRGGHGGGGGGGGSSSSSSSAGSQQAALESFYGAQAGAYDVTRGALLKGREDMLALAAAQLALRWAEPAAGRRPRIWVDIGGGTGWNIEAMAAHVDVPRAFDRVYLVDLSPSLCAVARRRFARLGWANVHVVCADARAFRLDDDGADLITLSYSLSMIPDYYAVVDALAALLAPAGIVAAVDFYVQSQADVCFRNYTGGRAQRHVGFVARAFWRAWFDLDRVSLDAGRRDYLEYRFGTVLGCNGRNRALGAIPYYIWLGCPKTPRAAVERIDAMVTEGAAADDGTAETTGTAQGAPTAPRSKAFQAAAANRAAGLPLPAFFYQNHHWRIDYDDRLAKHTQFRDAYIYAFTWEDARVDERLLRLGPDDVVLAIASAGDNILSYARQGPRRIHAVDLNPAQNHLLELKCAALAAALPYDDVWQLFGEGRHPDFRALLLTRLSPHLSSRAFQYWLQRAAVFHSSGGGGGGLYDTGGSRNALRLFRWLCALCGCRGAVRAILAAKTLNEQRELWHARLRPALLSRLLARLVVSQERFLWAALGVPKNQLAMIEADYQEDCKAAAAAAGTTTTTTTTATTTALRSHAIWNYMVQTLDPMVEHVHLAADNPYYHVCVAGRFARRCPPDYLSRQAHAALTRPGALDGLRIHTDAIDDVLARLAPGSLTVAVLMDSMDWFDPDDPKTTAASSSSSSSSAATAQVAKLNRALALGGRVLLRSSARRPWYLAVFARLGFAPKAHGIRTPGTCIDRVNMYASCWICTKVAHLPPPTPSLDDPDVGPSDIDRLVI